MNKTGPIIIIDDDADDVDMYYSMFEELGTLNEMKMFSNGDDAITYLHRPDVKPFLILSDVSMHPKGGFEIRKMIAANPVLHKSAYRLSSSPRAFLRPTVEQAYNLSVQGLFQKPANFDDWKELVRNMVVYWKDCIAPNTIS